MDFEKTCRELHDLDDVLGCLFISPDGQVKHCHLTDSVGGKPEKFDWKAFLSQLEGLDQAEILFENARLYIRSTESGYLILLLEIYATISLVKLQCDVLVPQLNQVNKNKKGLKRFFKK